MKARKSNILFVFLYTAFLFSLTSSDAKAEANWYPFDITGSMDSASPFVAYMPNHDAVAGEHGFNKRIGSGFRFEDGTPAKFWGSSLNFKAVFPSHSDAEFIADKMAFFGFNSVRFHHLDMLFEPDGIFKDMYPNASNPQQKITGILSPSQLDKLDYFIKQCKLRGIYIDFCLLVARQFTEADGVVSASELGQAAKPVSIFDPRLKELQKQYAKDLLTHYNPYTGLTYADDPAIALIETINECSLISYWKKGRLNNPILNMSNGQIPSYYISMLDNLWNVWLQNKYSNPQNVYSAYGNPSPDTTQLLIAQTSSNWNLSVLSTATATVSKSTSSAVIHVTKSTGTEWHVQYHIESLNLKASKAYVIRFKGSADRNFSMTLCAQMNQAPDDNLGLYKSVILDTTTKQYEILFVPTQNYSDSKIGFYVGAQTGNVTLADIEIYEQGSSLVIPQNWNLTVFDFDRPIYQYLNLYPAQAKIDIQKFYEDLQQEYAAEMTAYLKNECGVKVPITVFAGPESYDNSTQNDADFLDRHTYWDHPGFPNSEWDENDFTINGLSMFLDNRLGMIGDIKDFTLNNTSRPYTVTEWQHCYPNPYTYESPLLIGIEGIKNGWDGLFQFSFYHGYTSLNISNIKDFFDTFCNPQQLIMTALGGRIYQQSTSNDLTTTNLQNGVLTINSPSMRGAVGFIAGKTFNFGVVTLKPNTDGAFVIFSSTGVPLEQENKFVLVALNDVKNTNSYWDSNGKFIWGSSPTILKGVSVDLVLNKNASLTAYTMNNRGTRSTSMGSISAGGTMRFDTLSRSTPWFELNLQDMPPTITGITPSSGAVGSSVTISGTNFNNATSVSFNNVSASFTVNSSTQITAVVPASATSGTIKVVTPGGTATSSSSFTIAVAQTPAVTLSSSPSSNTITAGSNAVYTIDLSRTNFTGSVTLSVSGLPAGASANFSQNPTTSSSATLTVSTTSGTTLGLATFSLNATASGLTINPINLGLTVNQPAPTLTGFTPSSGPVGSSVTISGTNFSNATSVSFNNVSASFTVNSSTQITAVVPANATSGTIKVVTPGGTATSSASFTVVATQTPAVTLSSSPSSNTITAGSNAVYTINLSRINFTGSVTLSVSGLPAGASANFSQNPTTSSSIALTVSTTSGTTLGLVTFSLNATASGLTINPINLGLTVNQPAPTLTNFTPSSGYAGNSIVLTGTNFTNVSSVSFNNVSASFTVNSATQITAVVPANATSGTIKVVTPGGTATSSSSFTVTQVPSEIAPPSPVGNLTAGAPTINSMVLTWTAPGDDANTGTAFAYDIRYSQMPISEVNFNNTVEVLGVPAPQQAGASEHFTVYPLEPGKFYYFALKTIDNHGNISVISNITSAATLNPPVDTDQDGFNDEEEISRGTNINDPDTDDDVLNDFEEIMTYHTDPLNADSDGDGMPDGQEIVVGTNPNQDNKIADTDHDGLSDADELTIGTDLNNPDSDNDGYMDGKEVQLGLNPLDEASLPVVIKITADNKYTLYVNGVLIGSDANWTTIESYALNLHPGDSIAIKGEDLGGIAAMACNITHGPDIQVSDFVWHAYASNTDPTGWTDPNFDDSSWPSAKEHYSMGQGPWRNLPGLSSKTNWIWSNDANNHNKVFFRTKYNPAQNALIKATGDNEIIVYKNGEVLASGTNWTNVKFISAHIQPGDLLAIRGIDRGGVGAVIGDVTWRDNQGNLRTLTTDSSWKVSTVEVSGWEYQDFDDSAWSLATSIGALGKSPWGKANLLSYLNSNSQWIWSRDSKKDDDVWLRKVIPNAKLTLTCDNAFEVYKNGRLIGKGNNWKLPQSMGLMLNTGDVIAVKAMDTGGTAGFMASIIHEGGLKTLSNSTWRVSPVEESGWTDSDFDDSHWQESSVIGPNGMSAWGYISSIDAGAQWIWTADNLNDNTVYFRFRIGDNNTPVGLTQIKVAADNSYRFYKNGNLIISGSNWTSPQNFSITLKSGDVIAVEASDTGYKAGMILSATGAYNFTSDASWKLSAALEEGWNTQAFNDSGWIFATSYGVYGASPWGQNTPLFAGTGAQWVWSSRNQTGSSNIDSKVYLRKMIQ